MKRSLAIIALMNLTLATAQAQSENTDSLTLPKLMCSIQKESKPNEWTESVAMQTKTIIPGTTTTIMLRQDGSIFTGAVLSETGAITLHVTDFSTHQMNSLAFTNHFEKVDQVIGTKLPETNELLSCVVLN